MLRSDPSSSSGCLAGLLWAPMALAGYCSEQQSENGWVDTIAHGRDYQQRDATLNPVVAVRCNSILVVVGALDRNACDRNPDDLGPRSKRHNGPLISALSPDDRGVSPAQSKEIGPRG